MRVRLSNQQSEIPLRVRPLLRQLKKALELLPRPLPEGLAGLEFVLVDRRTMKRVHGDFLGDPTETDVITFPYGEILICPAMAREQSAGHGTKLEEEILLYALHGLLHLAGFDDTKPGAARIMNRAQGRLLRRVVASVSG